MSFVELSTSAQTAYAQLLDAALGAEHQRSVADLSGSFNAKQVRGRKYWYFQVTEPSGRLRQIYVGPDSGPVRRLIEQRTQPGPIAALQPLARAAIALGNQSVVRRHARVLRRLAEYGFFRAGGMLIGTHAYLTYGNMLGVRFGQAELTQDLDFAHAGKSLAIALPTNVEAPMAKAIDSLRMGFLPAQQLAGQPGGTFLIPSEPQFRLDFMTPLHRGRDAPFEHPSLHVMLQPMKFVEYLLETIEQAVAFSADTAVLVTVPDPARFALHKLIVQGERAGGFRTKALKDIRQAAQLLDFLWSHRQRSVREALKDLKGRGPGWRKRLRSGVAALLAAHPALATRRALVRALGAER